MVNENKKRPVSSQQGKQHGHSHYSDGGTALKRCKQEFFDEGHNAAVQQMVTAVEEVARCGICTGTVVKPCTLSTCEHTFCRRCIEEALRSKGCCPQCLVPAWHRDIRDSRHVSAIMHALRDDQSIMDVVQKYPASFVRASAGPAANIVYDLFNQVVSIRDPTHASGYRPKFYFVMEYKVIKRLLILISLLLWLVVVPPVLSWLALLAPVLCSYMSTHVHCYPFRISTMTGRGANVHFDRAGGAWHLSRPST
jgi:hypothetical protein